MNADPQIGHLFTGSFGLELDGRYSNNANERGRGEFGPEIVQELERELVKREREFVKLNREADELHDRVEEIVKEMQDPQIREKTFSHKPGFEGCVCDECFRKRYREQDR